MQYIDCKKYAQEILDAVKAIPDKKKLVIISVGNNPASESYVKGKIKDCEYCGIPYEVVKLDETMLSPIISSITTRNWKQDIGGIIVQLPLPDRFKEYEDFIVNQVQIDKDVDGFRQDSPFKPCTPEGIMYLLRKELGDLTGKTALVIGRGKLVGEPIAKMLIDADCTVTVAHSKTKNLDMELAWHHDIIISAVGKPNFIDLQHCNADIVIDVGVNRNENGKLCGDCYNFNDTGDGLKVTPVPGGIGLMTRAMLMAHVAGLDVNTIN